MATYYWIGSGTQDWTNTSSWSLTSGGISAGAYPTDVDLAVFDSFPSSTSRCRLPATTIVGGLIVNSYSGGFDFASTSAAIIIRDLGLDLANAFVSTPGLYSDSRMEIRLVPYTVFSTTYTLNVGAGILGGLTVQAGGISGSATVNITGKTTRTNIGTFRILGGNVTMLNTDLQLGQLNGYLELNSTQYAASLALQASTSVTFTGTSIYLSNVSPNTFSIPTSVNWLFIGRATSSLEVNLNGSTDPEIGNIGTIQHALSDVPPAFARLTIKGDIHVNGIILNTIGQTTYREMYFADSNTKLILNTPGNLSASVDIAGTQFYPVKMLGDSGGSLVDYAISSPPRSGPFRTYYAQIQNMTGANGKVFISLLSDGNVNNGGNTNWTFTQNSGAFMLF